MKKYFAKYLPIEGEIKEGHLFRDEFGYIRPFTDDDTIMYEHSKNKPSAVKLFLCSDNIKVGEEYLFNVGYAAGTKIADEEALEDIQKGTDIGFKLIGEISPGAIWVKEGDEFIAEGNDCEVFPYHEHEEDESIVYVDKEGRPVDVPIFLIKNENGDFV